MYTVVKMIAKVSTLVLSSVNVEWATRKIKNARPQIGGNSQDINREWKISSGTRTIAASEKIAAPEHIECATQGPPAT
jgi:hypothetical protein